MVASEVNSKGQITIPANVRLRLGLGTGDRVEFVELADGAFAIKPAIDDVRLLKALLGKPAKSVSIEDMNAAIRAKGGKL